MFKPLALKLCLQCSALFWFAYANAGSLLIFFEGGCDKQDNIGIRLVKKLYVPLLNTVLKYKRRRLQLQAIVFFGSTFAIQVCRNGLMPYLDEARLQ